MNRTKLTVLWMLAASGAAPAGDPATAVRVVFSARMRRVSRAGPRETERAVRLRSRLARVAGNPEMVVPGAPNESELWELVRRGEMPPEDSPTGPLKADQKETIRVWIAAGAPAGGSLPPTAGDAPPAAPLTDIVPAQPSSLKQSLRRLGRLHVVLVHFPIALLIAAAAGEIRSVWRRQITPAPAVHFCVLLGASGAVTTAALGWLLAWGGAGVGMPVTLGLHRWFGTATAGWAVLTAVLSVRDERRGVRGTWFRMALLIATALVGATGHLGGILVYGPDFLSPLSA